VRNGIILSGRVYVYIRVFLREMLGVANPF